MPFFSLRRSSSATPFLFISSRGEGFTLVEMLVAIAVLSLLMLFTAAMMSSATTTTFNSNKHLNAYAQARLVFDRMQMDLDGMLKRHDLDFQFTKQTGNDMLYFYSQAPGYFDGGVPVTAQSDVSLVGYSVNTAHQLQRLGRGLQWTDVAFIPAVFTVGDTDTNFHVLAPGVFRLEVAFVLRQDDNTFKITDTPPVPGSQDFGNLWAIMVDIGVLDTDSRATVQSYTQLISALPDFTGSQTLTLTTPASPGSTSVDPILNSWNVALSSPSFYQTAGIPKAAAVQVRIFERTFNLK